MDMVKGLVKSGSLNGCEFSIHEVNEEVTVISIRYENALYIFSYDVTNVYLATTLGWGCKEIGERILVVLRKHINWFLENSEEPSLEEWNEGIVQAVKKTLLEI